MSVRANSKKKWNVLNNMLGRRKGELSDRFEINGNICSDPQVIADEFCKYFVEYPETLHSNIPDPISNYSHLIPFNEHSFVFFPCTVNEILCETMNMKTSSSISDIPTKFIKMCKFYLSPILCELLNICFDTGVYPNIYKIALVTPIYKKKERIQFKNHRPISILSNINKIFEKIVLSRLTNFFVKYGLLSGNQFGFRKNMNTELATFQLVSKILPAFERGTYCICVYLDYSACFDTISRELLFGKLYRYGIKGMPLEFIKTYFSGIFLV